MFNTINFHFNSQQHTAGQLAECLLFYDKVNLFAKIDDMANLITTIGFNELVELSHFGLRIITTDSTLGILPFYNSISNTYEVRVNPVMLQYEDLTHRYLSKAISTALQITDTELELHIAKLRSVTDLYSLGGDITKLIHQEALSPFASRLLYNELETKGAGHLLLNGTLHYQFCGNDESIKLETNMDEPSVAKEIKRFQVQPILNHNSFLLNLATSMLFLQQSAYYGGEMTTSTSEERTIFLKLNMLQNIVNNQKDIQLVQKMANPEYHSIADTLDQGRKTFQELIQLLEKAQKFKEWKRTIPDKAEFITEYSKAVAMETKWADNIFVKSGRWFTTTLIGAIPGAGMVLGPVSSAFDTFILDKMLKKWSPNQFLQKDVRDFVKKS